MMIDAIWRKRTGFSDPDEYTHRVRVVGFVYGEIEDRTRSHGTIKGTMAICVRTDQEPYTFSTVPLTELVMTSLPDEKESTRFADAVRDLIRRAGIRQADVATIAGVSQSTVNAWLNNGFLPRDDETKKRMRGAFVTWGVPTDGLKF